MQMIVKSDVVEFNEHIRWYEDGIWKPRIDIVMRCVSNWQGKKVLDLGCGIGTFAIESAKRGAEVTAVDAFNEARRCCKELAIKHGVSEQIKIVDSNVFDIQLPEGTFDIIIIADLIEHLANPLLFLTKIRRLGKPGSLLICTTPNLFSLHSIVRHLFAGHFRATGRWLKSLMRLYRKNRKDEDDPSAAYVGHVNEYDPIRLSMEFKKCHYEIVYHASYSWNWEEDAFVVRSMFKYLLSSPIFRMIQGKRIGLLFGHDQILVARTPDVTNEEV